MSVAPKNELTWWGTDGAMSNGRAIERKSHTRAEPPKLVPESAAIELLDSDRERAMKAAVYTRVSTEEQRERQTIQTQRQFAEQYCKLHEIPVAGVYSDDGVTGTLPLSKRPAGIKLLEDAKASKFDTVLFYKLDRLGRDPRLTLNAVDELESCGVKIKSMTEPFDTGDATGRFLLTILSGVAGLERETFMERSRAGTERLARDGCWLGGIVPYGYRVEGKKRDARLVISEDPLPDLPMSEADVIRMVFHLSSNEGWSCCKIAKHLTTLGIPPAYARDGRKVARGKRKQATAGIWWAGRIGNLLTNTTYKGLHYYGRRSKKKREVIERHVPAIVDRATWESAQETLRKGRVNARRNTRRRYLLRSFMKCGKCGLTYIGSTTKAGTVFYRCSGKNGRGPYAVRGETCPSKPVPGEIEEIVWADVERFLRNPGTVLETLARKMDGVNDEQAMHQQNVDLLEMQLAEKGAERERVLLLYRRGTVDAALLEKQMAAIDQESRELTTALQEAQEALSGLQAARTAAGSVEALLRELNGRLDGDLTWKLKHELVEALVDGIRVETVQENGHKEAVAHVTYRFATPELPLLLARTPVRFTIAPPGSPCRTGVGGGRVQAWRGWLPGRDALSR